MDVYLKICLKNKKAQLTIFIILALILVVMILIFFAIRNPPKVQLIDEENPQSYIESCTRGAADEAISIISRNGGDINPKGYVMYNGEEIVYMCFNGVFYRFCINQRPLLIEHIENEITNYTYPRVADCFKTLELRLGKKYDAIETGDMKLATRLYPNQVVIEINKKFKIIKGEKIRDFEKFKINIISPIYNFADIAMEVANQEAQYCNFDDLGYMILYPRFDISRILTGDSDHIYFIKERTTNQEFRFATRSCILPPGF